MKNENREFKSIDVTGGSHTGTKKTEAKGKIRDTFYKDQMHMPNTGMNYFGCRGRGDY
ncbi:hypothetical protein SAMN02745945_03020 [Peptoclostridium litorale DSM 5388]|uniref:Uncharacterized protein n=1 Tax=Peptoclostridium litorale DSM 5388 TaxID=1121324 RepID=A0A069RE32_PEPLI|nr:hypothetical protein [Peptoclostridium litorale]KDR94455.1 hypothetical protein CLIT_19c00050 [Peptoclostridium litorale DSM 5388]SIO37625.1 hypothetical protein SAMN02745945_03020 [Peptoclostridium litorale DSM 5388]